MKIPKMFVVCS